MLLRYELVLSPTSLFAFHTAWSWVIVQKYFIPFSTFFSSSLIYLIRSMTQLYRRKCTLTVSMKQNCHPTRHSVSIMHSLVRVCTIGPIDHFCSYNPLHTPKCWINKDSATVYFQRWGGKNSKDRAKMFARFQSQVPDFTTRLSGGWKMAAKYWISRNFLQNTN